MKDMGRIKQIIDQQLAELQKQVNNSSIVDLRKKFEFTVERAKEEINEEIDRWEALNAKADPVADSWLDQLKRSRYSALIVFAIAAGLVGLGVFLGAVVQSWFC